MWRYWTLPLLRFERKKMQFVYKVSLPNKILRNHLLFKHLQWNYASFIFKTNRLRSISSNKIIKLSKYFICGHSWHVIYSYIKQGRVSVLNILLHILNMSGLHIVIVPDLLFVMRFWYHHVNESQGLKPSIQAHVVHGIIWITLFILLHLFFYWFFYGKTHTETLLAIQISGKCYRTILSRKTRH